MKIIVILTLLVLVGCTPKFSKFFKYNTYKNKNGVQITNEAINLTYQAFGDIDHIERKRIIRKRIKQQKIEFSGEILIYGETKIDPSYSYVVVLSDHKIESNYFTIDSTINNGTISFIGFPKEDQYLRNMKSDLKTMFRSMKLK